MFVLSKFNLYSFVLNGNAVFAFYSSMPLTLRHAPTISEIIEIDFVIGYILIFLGKKGLVYSYLVRQDKEHHYLDVRLAVCGNVDAGKRSSVFLII